MNKMSHRHGAESTDHRVSNVRRMIVVLAASVLAWTVGYSPSAVAGALKQAWVEEIQVLDAHGNVLTQPVTLKHLQNKASHAYYCQ